MKNKQHVVSGRWNFSLNFLANENVKEIVEDKQYIKYERSSLNDCSTGIAVQSRLHGWKYYSECGLSVDAISWCLSSTNSATKTLINNLFLHLHGLIFNIELLI